MPLRPPGSTADMASRASGLTLADILDWVGDKADLAGNLRYGMSTAEKEALASRGSLPGAPVDRSENQDVANRYAAGYLFNQQYPSAAPYLQPVVDQVKTSGLWWLGGDSPEAQSWAGHGGQMSAMARAGQQPRTLGEMVAIPPPPKPSGR